MLQTLLTTHDVVHATSTHTLFSGVSIIIKKHDRIGLVGKNGSGKTTLLRLLRGDIEPQQGTVTCNGSVGYVPQISQLVSVSVSVYDFLRSKNITPEQFEYAHKRIFSSKPPGASSQVSTLSGGEQTKLWIAAIVSLKPDILFLDEPTNHLDIKSNEELVAWLSNYQSAVVFVSHNKTFLSKVAKAIWELENNTVRLFGTCYEEYVTQKHTIESSKERKFEAERKKLVALEAGVVKRQVRAVRARRTGTQSKCEKSREKSAENYFRNRSEKGVGKLKKQQDAERLKISSALTLLQKRTSKTVHVPLLANFKKGTLLADVTDVHVNAGSRTLLFVSRMRIEVGDRVAILGDNGTGKTLLLRRLIHEVRSNTSGAFQVAYIDQQYALIDKGKTVFENLEEAANSNEHELVYKQLGRFLFSEHYAHKHTFELSGGELARLAFAVATISPLDLLVLDEPTNNVDIETVEVIAKALSDFQGAIIVVSHDVDFLKSLHIERQYCILEGVLRLES